MLPIKLAQYPMFSGSQVPRGEEQGCGVLLYSGLHGFYSRVAQQQMKTERHAMNRNGKSAVTRKEKQQLACDGRNINNEPAITETKRGDMR